LTHWLAFAALFLAVVALLVIGTALHEWWQWRQDR
jgi:hypothetical protein